MRLAPLIGPDLQDAIAIGPEAVREAVSEFHAEDIAELLEDLSAKEAVTLVRALPTETAADVVERLSPSRQVLVFNAIDTGRAVELLGEMDPDDRVDLLQELEEDDAAALLAALERREPEAAEEVRELVQYEPETAGGLMTTQFASLPPETKVWEAMEAARRFGREEMAEMLYYIYVCRPNGELLGVVSLRDLILSEPGQALSEIMVENVFKVSAFDDQEQVADAIARYDLAALPVVDRLSRMLGVVTVDDVVDVVIEEATEDAQKMGGVVPLEESYFDTSWAEFVWKRGSWLVLLFIAQLLTATVIRQNQDFLAATVELVLFIPLIIASGGNAGSQSATLVIRAMAVGELRAGRLGQGGWSRAADRIVTGDCTRLDRLCKGLVRRRNRRAHRDRHRRRGEYSCHRHLEHDDRLASSTADSTRRARSRRVVDSFHCIGRRRLGARRLLRGGASDFARGLRTLASRFWPQAC